MYRSIATVAAFAAAALAQGQSIGDLLNSTADLSSLRDFLTSSAPDVLTTLAGASNITVLAPNNAAFQALGTPPNTPGFAQALLTYHVVQGAFSAAQLSAGTAFSPTLLKDAAYTTVSGGQVVETEPMDDTVAIYSGLFTHSMVVQADVNATNNVIIHVIDKVLSIPPRLTDVAVAANLTSLAGALTQLNLVDTLTGLSDITVFAPTNQAFEAIGSALPTLSPEQLTSILQYHVVNSSVLYSTDLSDGATVPTLNGGSVTVHITDGKVFVNSAQVVIPDVLVANGVVHVIDNVLNPNNTSATPNPSATPQPPAYSGASSGTEAPFTSGVPTPTAPLVTPTPQTSASGSGGTASGSAGGSGTASGSGASATGSAPAQSTGGASTLSGAFGAAALFGAGVVYMNM